jgi:hypothetical protein
MGSFQTKNSNLGKFGRALNWKMLIHITAIWNIFTDIWDILHMTICYFSHFGIMYQEKSGNPGIDVGN